MKNIYLVFCSIPLLFCACSYLDVDETTGNDKDFVFSYFDQLQGLVSNIYSHLPVDYGTYGAALRESATDNAHYVWSESKVYDIYHNAWSPDNALDNQWSKNYTAIRTANSFLENFDLEQLKRFEWNESYDQELAKAKMYPYEVRFLRAFYHFELAKRYGDIPLLQRTYSVEEVNNIEKTSFNKVIEFIVKECDEIAPHLPVSHKNYLLKETGRVTQGTVMALKSRALLYAASALHNPENDVAKWEAAAKAAHAIIKAGTYSLQNISAEPLYALNGGNDVLSSTQLIFERRRGNENSFESNNLPVGFEGGKSGNTPTQNLVDAYEMANGTPFDWNNSQHVKYPYYDALGNRTRDPRLYVTVLVNGSKYANTVIEPFAGGKHGSPIEGATPTGYYVKKYMNETVTITNNPVRKPHHFVIFRYAEVLLNYAEAMNEWKGPDYTDSEFLLSAREAVNQVRTSANMPTIADVSRANFRNRVRNERRVELAFEDHRFWDIRRWKTGNIVKRIFGVKITKVGDNYNYSKELVMERVWQDKMYLYPIPRTELFINENLSPQNPGWN